MFQTILMGLFLSYISFDVPSEEKVWLLTREDKGGLFAKATVHPIDSDETREMTIFVDDDCDCQSTELDELDEAFLSVFEEVEVVGQDDHGNLLLHSALFGSDDAPEFFLEGKNGFYYLKLLPENSEDTLEENSRE